MPNFWAPLFGNLIALRPLFEAVSWWSSPGEPWSSVPHNIAEQYAARERGDKPILSRYVSHF